MRIKIEDIVDRHKGTPAIVAAHGPSINGYKQKIIYNQKNKNWKRFSVNNWYNVFDHPPDYWVLSSTFYTIRRLHSIINKYRIPVFYSDDGDFTNKEWIEKTLLSEFLVYDQRHWQGKTCLEILTTFKKHYEKTRNFHFRDFGNNEVMWYLPRNRGNYGHSSHSTECCKQNTPSRRTIQESLLALSGHDQHYSTGDTVTLHAIAFAIIMGCNPIYISGMDLDYEKGHAALGKVEPGAAAEGKHSWHDCSANLLNDLQILQDSATKRGISIINLKENAWYKIFQEGKLP
jgi:hypothetical protein